MSETVTIIFVITIIIILFFLLYRNLVRPSLGFLFVVLIFTITGILNTKDVLSGFSNPSIASILLLILITAGLRKNFNIEQLFDFIFSQSRTYKGFLIRMMSQVAFLSTFINNTPVVALMTPYVFNWGKNNRIAPSKLLIPLSYATIMGGMITLIGTSTTLVLNGFLIDFNLPGLNPFYLLCIGVTVTITGIFFLANFGYKLLPKYSDSIQSFKDKQREYLLEAKISVSAKIVNKTIVDAGLRNLKGVYLVEIIRKNRVISPVEPAEIVEQDDVLIFAGDTQNIVDLIKKGYGLMLPDEANHAINGNSKVDVVEAVVSNNSSLIGKTVKEGNFRERYDAAIVAVHRNGEKLRGKIGEIKLNSGDLLLLYAGSDFINRADIYRDIYVVSKLREITKPGKKKFYALGLSLVAAIVLLILGKMSLFSSLLIIFSIMAAFNLINLQDVKRELDLNLIAILVFSLAIGQAIIKTGTGNLLGNYLLEALQPFGMIAVLVGLLLITTLLTSFITNVGAISIAFPLAYAIAQNLQIDGSPLYLGIAYAASAAFLTPIGYQTNLIVYGPGGYNFKDFFNVGLPVTFIYLFVVTIMLILLYHEVFLPQLTSSL